MDKFCMLSLTYRSNGFVTMLAPLRDYLRPKDPKSSSLLCAVKERYFSRMSIDLDPDAPRFAEARWIISEDINVEYLLDVFTTIEGSSDEVWAACGNFIEHLGHHKQRLTILKPKIEGLQDARGPRLECWHRLAWLILTFGNYAEAKRLATCALTHRKREGDDRRVVGTLELISVVNRLMGLYEEATGQAKEALEIHERLGDTKELADCLIRNAFLFHDDKKLDAAEETAFRALELSSENGLESRLCDSHRVLSDIYRSKGETEKAIHHREIAIRIASAFGGKYDLFWNHFYLADLLRMQGRFEEAQTHVEHANSAYLLAHAAKMQAGVFFRQRRFEEARSELLRAIDAFEKLAATTDVEQCRWMLTNQLSVEVSSS